MTEKRWELRWELICGFVRVQVGGVKQEMETDDRIKDRRFDGEEEEEEEGKE
jgi:hypothetical protein